MLGEDEAVGEWPICVHIAVEVLRTAAVRHSVSQAKGSGVALIVIARSQAVVAIRMAMTAADVYTRAILLPTHRVGRADGTECDCAVLQDLLNALNTRVRTTFWWLLGTLALAIVTLAAMSLSAMVVGALIWALLILMIILDDPILHAPVRLGAAQLVVTNVVDEATTAPRCWAPI